MLKYIQGDIHEVIKTIDADSIDFIYTDPPFGTTKAKWDKGLNWDNLFKDMWRVLKPNIIIYGKKIIQLDFFKLNINH